jgi:hypothetical protein
MALIFGARKTVQFVENWVFVDMIHLFAQMGVDLMERVRTYGGKLT